MTDRQVHDRAPILTLDEAAHLLRVSPRTVQRYVADGKLAALRTPGGHPRFRRSDVESLLAPQEATA